MMGCSRPSGQSGLSRMLDCSSPCTMETLRLTQPPAPKPKPGEDPEEDPEEDDPEGVEEDPGEDETRAAA